MMNCDNVPQQSVQILPVLRRELPWFALMVVALGATFTLSHFVVHHGLLLPSVASGRDAPLWIWGVLYAPELVALLMVGWRLRSWALVGLYAGGAAALREGFHLALCWLGHVPSHRFGSALTEIAIALPLTAAAYALVFVTASSTGRAESASRVM